MNQNFYNSNSSGFDQTQLPQFPVIHPPPQETSIEIVHDQENAINSVQTFLRKFNRYSFLETPKVLLLAWDRVFEIKNAFRNKQYNPEDVQELFREIFNDVQNIHEELAEYINTPGCDDESKHEEVIYEMSFKTYLNLLFNLDEEIISSEFNPIHNEDLDSTPKNDRFVTDSYLLESSLNRDTLMISSLKIDSLLAEFADIHLVERLLYDNSSPRPPEEFVSENSNANIESFFPSPIPNEDSDSRMKEIDLFLTLDDPMPPSIEDDDDSKRDILIHEELLDNYSLSLPENESFHFDIPSSSRPPVKPPDGNIGILNIKMMGDISEQKKFEDSCQRILSSKSSFP
nr:hypothetical protein [Tanacetum cinerariifolium]